MKSASKIEEIFINNMKKFSDNVLSGRGISRRTKSAVNSLNKSDNVNTIYLDILGDLVDPIITETTLSNRGFTIDNYKDIKYYSQVIISDMESIPNDSCGLITMFHSFHSISKIKSFIIECNKVMRWGGLLYIYDFRGTANMLPVYDIWRSQLVYSLEIDELHSNLMRNTYYSIKSVRKLLTDCMFEIGLVTTIEDSIISIIAIKTKDIIDETKIISPNPSNSFYRASYGNMYNWWIKNKDLITFSEDIVEILNKMTVKKDLIKVLEKLYG